MNGFLLIDKPEGVTSFYCVKVLRRIFNMKRIGFAGTLDPLATGLMIVALGEATKLMSFLEKMDKVYEVKIRFGAVSDTYDAKGVIKVVENYSRPTKKMVEKALDDDFAGVREQVPPAFSAIQIGGKRAYALARQGKSVILKSRPVNFYELKIKSFAWPVLHMVVHCSSGTYVRSLAHDLGRVLGCGGYVEGLRRLKIGTWKVSEAIPLDLTGVQGREIPIAAPHEFFADWQQFNLTEGNYHILAHGGFVENTAGFTGGPILALYGDKCVGVLELYNGQLKFRKKFNTV